MADCGERYWRLPLYPDFDTQIKSDIADLKNTGGRAGGAETAGAFLKAFVGDTPWIHLDVAGTAYLDTESAYLAKGPNGTPVRALVALVEDLAAHGAGATNGVAKATVSAMNPQEPVVPDPTPPGQPGGPVVDPSQPDQPAEYEARKAARGDAELDDYDKSVADSFPASDPPAASEPGA